MTRLLLPLALFANSLRSTGYLREHWRWVIPAAWALMSYLIVDYTSSHTVEKRRESLASMCDERARMLQYHVNANINNLQALAILLSTFHHSSAIDQMTFARYAKRTVFERPLTSGLAYGVRVNRTEREQFEVQQGWSIKKMYSSKTNKSSLGPGNTTDAEVREPAEEYAPVIFAQEAYKHVISYDLLSGADDRDNVLRARESGKCVLTAPFKLLTNNHIGVISTIAVYKYELPRNARPQERIEAAIGYLGGIIFIEALVDELLHEVAVKQSIMVNVYDTTNERPIRMYGSNYTGTGMLHVSLLNFGDPSRRHEMHCRFIQSPPWPWMAITSPIGTLVIALLIAMAITSSVGNLVIALLIAKRIARVEDDYEQMIVLKTHADSEDNIAKPQIISSNVELEQDEIADNVEEKLDEDERKLEEVGIRSKLIIMVNEKLTSARIHSLPSRFCYLNKKVVSVSLLGLMLYILVIGAFDLPFNQSLGIRRENQVTILNKFGWSRGRLLIGTLHGAWPNGGVENSDMISDDVIKIPASSDGWISVDIRKHWHSHISSKYQEEATEMQHGTVKPHLPAGLSHEKTMVGPWIALVSVILLVLGIAVCVLLWCKLLKRVQQNELELSGGIMGPRRFQLCELVAATGSFADENKLGQGGFGPVYKGYLQNQDCHVAIKVLSSQQQSEQGLREFKAEVKVMTQLKHRNIVNLVGWCECDSQQRLLLVYELMCNNLDF